MRRMGSPAGREPAVEAAGRGSRSGKGGGRGGGRRGKGADRNSSASAGASGHIGMAGLGHGVRAHGTGSAGAVSGRNGGASSECRGTSGPVPCHGSGGSVGRGRGRRCEGSPSTAVAEPTDRLPSTPAQCSDGARIEDALVPPAGAVPRPAALAEALSPAPETVPQEPETVPPAPVSRACVGEWSGVASLLRPACEAGGLAPETVKDNRAAQLDEVLALRSIYGDEMSEPSRGDGFVFEFEVPVEVPPAVALGAIQAAGASCPSLPPLKLRVRFDEAYPSSAPPSLAVRCCWMTDAQVEAVAAGLDAVAEAARGEPIVCAWLEWLRGEALSAVGLDSPGAALSLPEEVVAPGAGRAARWPRDRRSVLATLRRHAAEVEEKEWAAALHR